MPDGLTIAPVRDDDPFGWAMELAGRLRRRRELTASDRNALSDFLEEWADEMLAAVRSQLVNLLAHAAKVAKVSTNQERAPWTCPKASAVCVSTPRLICPAKYCGAATMMGKTDAAWP